MDKPRTINATELDNLNDTYPDAAAELFWLRGRNHQLANVIRSRCVYCRDGRAPVERDGVFFHHVAFGGDLGSYNPCTLTQMERDALATVDVPHPDTKDARRYRHLRRTAHWNNYAISILPVADPNGTKPITERLDDAIDRAMEGEKPPATITDQANPGIYKGRDPAAMP